MRDKGERVRVLSEERKGGGRIVIQTESVYTSCQKKLNEQGYDIICIKIIGF